MGTGTNQYRPDYAVPPGAILEECLETHGISPAEFARRCGPVPQNSSAKSSQGRRRLNRKPRCNSRKSWESMQASGSALKQTISFIVQERARRKRQKKLLPGFKTFPLKELVNRKMLDKPASDTEVLQKLLTFFGVGSINAWHTKYEQMNVTYRHSPRFQSDKTALATWLRLGELEAEQQECADYNGTQFKQALKRGSRTHAKAGRARPGKGANTLQQKQA